MYKRKIFISNVQSEFREERPALNDYILADPFWDKFFESLLFELPPSVPANPCLAEPMFFAGYIERLGLGTSDMIELAKITLKQRKEPEFAQDILFKASIYRTSNTANKENITISTKQVTKQAKRLIYCLRKKEMTVKEIMDILELKHRPTFPYDYLKPATDIGLIEMIQPDSPTKSDTKISFDRKR